MNRSLFIGCLALGAAAAVGVVHRQLTAVVPTGTTRLEPALPRPALAPQREPAALKQVVSASPESARLAARRQLYESVDALVQASEFEQARKLLDEDQARYADDLAPEWRDLQQSYRLIADCLEHPTPTMRMRAQAFVGVSPTLRLGPRILAACQPSRREFAGP